MGIKFSENGAAGICPPTLQRDPTAWRENPNVRRECRKKSIFFEPSLERRSPRLRPVSPKSAARHERALHPPQSPRSLPTQLQVPSKLRHRALGSRLSRIVNIWFARRKVKATHVAENFSWIFEKKIPQKGQEVLVSRAISSFRVLSAPMARPMVRILETASTRTLVSSTRSSSFRSSSGSSDEKNEQLKKQRNDFLPVKKS